MSTLRTLISQRRLGVHIGYGVEDVKRYVLRDAVKHSGLSRETWKSIASTEHELRTGDAELISREEVIDQMKPAPEEVSDDE